MTPAVLNPRAVVLVLDGEVAETATNISPELVVEVVTCWEDFNKASEGMTFNSTRSLPAQEPLNSAYHKSKQ